MSFNEESRTINARKNVISVLGCKTLSLCLGFVARVFFIKYIGVEFLGINNLFSNVLTLLSLADLGVGTAINVCLYKPLAEKNIEQVTARMHFFRRVYYVIGISVFVLGIISLPILPYIVNIESPIENLEIYYLIFVAKSASSYFFAYKSSLIQADQNGRLVNRVELYVNIIKVATQIIFIIICRVYMVYLIIEFIAVIIQNLWISHIANKLYPFILRKKNIDSNDKNIILKNIYSIFVYRISWVLLNGTDNIIISVLVGTIYVGLYANYYMVISGIALIVGMIFNTLTPSIGNLVVSSLPHKRYKTFLMMQLVCYWISSLVSICFYFVIQDFICLWIGGDMKLEKIVIVAMAVDLYFANSMRTIWSFREGVGMYNKIKYVMAVTATLNCFLSIILGKYIGISGIIFATTLSKLLTYYMVEPRWLFNEFFNVKSKFYYVEYIKNVSITCVCFLILYYPMEIIKGGVFCLIVKGIICMCIVSFVYYLFSKDTYQFKIIKEKIELL